MTTAAIGFRAKTGRAVAVVLSGAEATPAFVWRGTVSLVDPAIPATAEPYHEVLRARWNDAAVTLERLQSAIEDVAEAVVRSMVADMRSREMEVAAVGVVGSPQRDLQKIYNEHIRAHASEGILFRRVLEVSASRNRLTCCAFSEGELRSARSAALGSIAQVESTLNRIGRVAGPPWRADERLAATAAWMALKQ